MKSISRQAGGLTAVFLAAVTLAGCAAIGEKHRTHHPQPPAPAFSGDTSRPGAAGQRGMMGSAGGPMGMADPRSMCDMHQRMKGAKTAEERSAMMDEHMRNMSPEMRQRHMEMLQQHCR
jgi:hypothetical protein